jgi:hypothetical protein
MDLKFTMKFYHWKILWRSSTQQKIFIFRLTYFSSTQVLVEVV